MLILMLIWYIRQNGISFLIFPLSKSSKRCQSRIRKFYMEVTILVIQTVKHSSSKYHHSWLVQSKRTGTISCNTELSSVIVQSETYITLNGLSREIPLDGAVENTKHCHARNRDKCWITTDPYWVSCVSGRGHFWWIEPLNNYNVWQCLLPIHNESYPQADLSDCSTRRWTFDYHRPNLSIDGGEKKVKITMIYLR